MPFPTASVLNSSASPVTVNTLPNAGQNTKAETLGVNLASDDDLFPKIGPVAETAPASDTASSGLNGRLQRIAQRLTSLIAQLPASLGIKTAANSLSITHASDDTVVVAIGAPADAAWTTGSGSEIALLKTIAGAALDTTTPSPVKIDQTTPGTTNRVALPELTASANVAKTYTGMFTVAGTALTRPANVTAYSIGDSISNNATAASVTTTAVALSDTNDHPVDLVEILLDTADTGPGTAGATIRLHLYNADYTASTGVQAGDNAARSQKKNGWLGSFSGVMSPFFDGSRGRLIADVGNLLVALPATGTKNYYWELEARTAFTPSANSTTFTPTFKGFQARPA